MKRIFTSALVILLTIGAAQAQTTPGKQHKGHNIEHKMAYEKLNLTTEQKARLQALKEEHKKQAAELKANTQLSEADRKVKRQALRQQHKTQMEAILTPAQKTELDKMKAERKTTSKRSKGLWKKDGMQKGQRGEGKGFGRSAEMEKELGLSADQKVKMEQVRTDFRTKMQSLRNDNALTQEQKKTQMRDLMKQQQEQKKTILTKEQQEKMQSLRKERAARNTK
jgi:Spy/CpxP family protein refolding chaperone